MKQIETTKGHILAVKKLIGDATKQEVDKEQWLKFINEGYVFLGYWSTLSEEQAAMMVDEVSFRKYKDYLSKPMIFESGLKSALESFASLMHANGICLINPIGNEPNYERFSNDETYNSKLAKWQKYQEATGEYLILFKPNK